MNKRTMSMAAAALFVLTTAGAVERITTPEDTTITVGNQTITIDTDSGRTVVRVFDKQGQQLKKTRETEYVDGQEVERVFVGSPFLPTARLQNMEFKPVFPTVYAGLSTPKDKFLGDIDTPKSHAKTSFAVGVTTLSFGMPFDKEHISGLTAALQFEYRRVNFQKNYQIVKDGDGRVGLQHNTGGQSSLAYYTMLRLPVMYTVNYYGRSTISIGLAPEWRFNSRASYTDSQSEETTVKNVVRPFGVSLDASMSFGPLVIYATCGLSPLFRKSGDFKVFSGSFTAGIDLWKIIGRRRLPPMFE